MKNLFIRLFPALLVLTLLLSACGGSGTAEMAAGNTSTWQEQYDLGIKFLSEGNYEDAIIAFTAAIEIDPKHVDAYISLADTFAAQDDYESALNILAQGIEATGDSALEDYRKKLEAMQDPWGSLTSQQQEMLLSLDAAVRNFDKYTVEAILPSEEFEQLYTTSPLSWTYEEESRIQRGLNITSDTGTNYLIKWYSSHNNDDTQDIHLNFIIDYHSASHTAYACSWNYSFSDDWPGQYGFHIKHRTLNEEGIADGPYEEQNWYRPPDELNHHWVVHSTVGTARNGVKVGTETITRHNNYTGGVHEGCVYVIEYDENGYITNYPAEWVNEHGMVEYRCSMTEGSSGCFWGLNTDISYKP